MFILLSGCEFHYVDEQLKIYCQSYIIYIMFVYVVYGIFIVNTFNRNRLTLCLMKKKKNKKKNRTSKSNRLVVLKSAPFSSDYNLAFQYIIITMRILEMGKHARTREPVEYVIFFFL